MVRSGGRAGGEGGGVVAYVGTHWRAESGAVAFRGH